ncbi:MAG TPA: hypothetical protein VFJ30_13055 [Phycisphaerae bacterium]|nr:hypothetical protein [Phycisphaerae bacterium]
MTYRLMLLALALPALGGCGGGYILTAPDTTAVAGQAAPVVVRLQRQEFWLHCPPVPDAPMTFRLADGQVWCARSDKRGYAAVALPAPAEPGRHEVKVHLQDNFGDTVAGAMSLYVLPADRPVVAVDLDCLPADPDRAGPAVEALKRVGATSEIVYLSQEHGTSPAAAHALLDGLGCPDGAVVPWKADDPWYARMPLPWRKPASSVPASLRARIPGLWAAVSSNPAAVDRFKEAGLKAVLVGETVEARPDEQTETWPNLILSKPKD